MNMFLVLHLNLVIRFNIPCILTLYTTCSFYLVSLVSFRELVYLKRLPDVVESLQLNIMFVEEAPITTISTTCDVKVTG